MFLSICTKCDIETEKLISILKLLFFCSVYLILGHYYEHVGLMVALYNKGLLKSGDYFVVGIDIEQYDADKPDKYMRGLLMDKTDERAEQAFQSYLGIFPSATIAFDEFAKKVSYYL